MCPAQELSTPGDDAEVRIVRLGPGDEDLARQLFAVLDDVFDHDGAGLSDRYVTDLLARDGFWAVAAVVQDRVVGGLTAHELPMTRDEQLELFLYDLAVLPAFQRRGIASQLVRAVVAAADAAGITVVFVPADDEDTHALAFYDSLGGRPAPVTMYDLGTDG
jgi:aminoglycoside 3-N-acetyltransferase I